MTTDDVRAAAEQLVEFHDRFALLFGKANDVLEIIHQLSVRDMQAIQIVVLLCMQLVLQRIWRLPALHH